MSEYAKITEGQIQFAPRQLPRKIEIDGELVDVITTNPTGEMLEADGWMPLVETEKPDAPIGYDYVPEYTEEAGQIVQSWVMVEADLSAEQAMEIILGGESDETE